MTPQDQKTAQYVSEQAGITTVSQWQKSMNKEVDGVFEEGWNQPVQARPLLHPHEVRAQPANEMYVFARWPRQRREGRTAALLQVH